MAHGKLADPASHINYMELDADQRRADKLRAVAELGALQNVKWRKLRPDAKSTWLVPKHAHTFAGFIPIGTKAARAESNNAARTIFKDYTLGVATHRDDVVYNFSRSSLESRLNNFIAAYNTEIDRWKRAPKDANVDDFVSYDEISWDRDLKKDLARGRYVQYESNCVRYSLYRPFTKRTLYFDRILNGEIYSLHRVFPAPHLGNCVICVPGISGRAAWATMVADAIPNLSLTSLDSFQCFPFYVYDEDGKDRRENITDWALEQFRKHYKDKTITKWEIFRYVYGLLHHPGYREKFADNLKRELPRIPFAPDFTAFATAGRKLAKLHLDYESAKEFPLKEIITEGLPRSPRVESKMKLAKDKRSLVVNPSLTLSGIPPEVFDYQLGNRSALEWVIDQYQVYTDPKTGITSDPNAWGEEHDNPEYIVELVARVMTVSLETMKIVNSLPKDFA
jgi:predicted helicase